MSSSSRCRRWTSTTRPTTAIRQLPTPRAPSRRLDAREAESGCTGPHAPSPAGDALAKLGILDEIQGKTHHAALTSGGELVAKGEVEMGFFNLSEIPKGVTVAGPLPGPLTGDTVYSVAVLLNGRRDKSCEGFGKY